MKSYRGEWWMVLVAAACATGMGLYFQRVVIPQQVANAALHGSPRGNLSDIFPRWLGARELLLRGRDPYGPEVTREIQAGYYGRPIDLSRTEDPKDEQRFAYPVYVVFILAPTIGLPFEIVQKGSFWIFLLVTMAGVPLWLRTLKWRPSAWIQVSLILWTIGTPAVIQGLKLRQLSLLVAGLVVAAVVLLKSDHLIAAGALLALATIKPHLVWLLLLWLAVWTASDWRRRHRLALSFVITMIVLETASEYWLPHWIPRFWQAIQEYQRYTGADSVIDEMISPLVGKAASLLSLLMTGLICWKERSQAENSEAFARVLCLVFAVTVLVAPTFAPYNQILLLPAMLMLLRDRREIWERSIACKLLMGLAFVAAAFPWITAIPLAVFSLALPLQQLQKFWTAPFWTVWLIPVSVTSLMLVLAHGKAFGASGKTFQREAT
jgi:hypothetical protein